MPTSAVKQNSAFTVGKTTGEGIFIGAYVMEDRTGKSVGRFRVFAASQDLNIFRAPRQWHLYSTCHHDGSSGIRIPLNFEDTARELSVRRSWLGHESCKFNYEHYESQLFAGLRDGSAVGKWFIPTPEILCGRNGDLENIGSPNLYDLQDEGDFKDTFCGDHSLYITRGSDADDNARLYWSTLEHRSIERDMYACNFDKLAFTNPARPWHEEGYWMFEEDAFRASCRPVRVVPAP